MIRYVALRAKVRFEEVTGKTVLVGVIQDISERKISEQLILEKNISQKATKIKEEAISNMNFHIRCLFLLKSIYFKFLYLQLIAIRL